MLPSTCDQLPWRNIEVMSVGRMELRGHDAVDLQEHRQDVARQAELEKPRQRVEDDDRDGDVRRRPGRDDVPQGDHALNCRLGFRLTDLQSAMRTRLDASTMRRRSPSPTPLRCSPSEITAW